MNLGSASVIRGNARSLPLADDSVDLVVTSPPYFALRSYQDGGEHYAGQIGDEPTPAAFVASLLEVTRECVRVLKPSGSLWVNLGDKYAGGGNGPQGSGGALAVSDYGARSRMPTAAERLAAAGGARPKSLIGIPWRYALACIDDLGLILRAEVIWSKPNGLPESVIDRVRRSHEQWFHFTLSPRYFSAVDEIREQYDAPAKPRGQAPNGANPATGGIPTLHDRSPLGKLPGSVWTVPTEPLKVPDHLGVDHFAAFPTEWPKRIIQGWSPAGVCVACGEGRRPVVHQDRSLVDIARTARIMDGYAAGTGTTNHGTTGSTLANEADKVRRTITGYACACAPRCRHGYGPGDHHFEGRCPVVPPPPTTPAVILDPFGGTGTTALVAKALGRHGISVDMSADYCRLATWRTNDRNQLARVLDLPKQDTQPDDQLSMF